MVIQEHFKKFFGLFAIEVYSKSKSSNKIPKTTFTHLFKNTVKVLTIRCSTDNEEGADLHWREVEVAKVRLQRGLCSV